MKIIIYTVADCQFSKLEKEYLTTNKLAFEEKNLESNREFLTEMLTVSNNFAGTPVTKIEKDDGQIIILKGFTKDEFDTALGFAPPATAVAPAPTVEPIVAPVINPAPIPTVEPVKEPAPEPVVSPDPLNSILDDLKKAQGPDVEAPVPTAPPTTAPVVNPAPVPVANTAPAIPDFPTDK